MNYYDLIFVFVGNIICYINLIWIFSRISDYTLKFNLKFIISIVISSSLLTAITLLNIIPLKTILSLMLLIINIKILYNDEWDYLVGISSFIWLIGMLLDIVFMLSFSFLFNKIIKTDILQIEHIAMYVSTILLHISYNLISRLKIFKKLIKKFYFILQKFNLLIMLSIIVCMVLVGAYCVMSLKNFNKLILLLLLIIFASWIIFLKIKILYLNLISKETNELLLKNNAFYVNLNNETREFKHNLIHDLNGLKVLGNNKINRVIDTIILKAGILVNVNHELENLPVGINGIILQSIYQFKNSDVTLKIDNSLEGDIFNLIKPKTYNSLCKILGVSINNALDAISTSNNKILYFFINDDKNFINISILNNFSSKLDVDQLGSLDYSTKGESHGIGLFSILKSKDVKTNLKIVNNVFEINIKIKKAKNYI